MITLDQSAYLKRILKTFNMNTSNPIAVPLEKKNRLRRIRS